MDDEAPSDFRLEDDMGNRIGNIEVIEGREKVLGFLKAADIDTVDTNIRYIVGGDRFLIEEMGMDSNIYELKATDLIDYEGDDVVGGTLMIEITVSDGENNSVVELLTVSVLDVDDESPLMLRLLDDVGDRVGDIEVVEGVEKVLGFLTADDEDTAGTLLSYSVDNDKFVIEERGTGMGIFVLKATAAVDYEASEVVGGTVVIQITVDDGTNETVVESLTVTISDVYNESPRDISLLGSTGEELGDIVVEEETIEVLGTLAAVDGDAIDEAFIYTTGDTRFIIEETTVGSGVYELKATEGLDYEGVGVVGGTTMVEVTVSDGVNDAVVESLTITVGDVDDESPMMLRLMVGGVELENIEVDERSMGVLGTLTADDADTANANISYSVNDVRFAIEERGAGTGIFELKGTDLLDYEGERVDNGTTIVEVTMNDGAGNVGMEELTITVNDINDESPSNLRLVDDVGDDLLDIEVDEGSVVVLGTLTAEDADTISENLVYTIEDMRFMIEETGIDTGIYVLKTRASLDYEDLVKVSEDGTTIAQVTVSDGVVEHNYVGSFNISLRDVNDNIPEITVENLVSTLIDESLTGATVIGTVSVRDDDRTARNKTIVYRTDNSNFSIDDATGEIHFSVFEISGSDLEVSTTITASDGENMDTIEVTVTIDNTDDSQDAKISAQTFSVAENSQALSQGVLATTGGVLSYSVAVDADFQIDSSTGILRFKTVPDYEVLVEKEYSVVVTVVSGTTNDSALITIIIEDENDNAPTLLRLLDGDGNEVQDLAVVEGNVVVLGTLMADDADTVGELVYRVDNDRFEIEETGVDTGVYELVATRAVDYEGVEVSLGTMVIEVTVSDGVNDAVVESLTITVGDVDDESPMMLRLLDDVGMELQDIEVEEGVVGVLGTLTAEDVDTAGSDLSYMIEENDYFAIEEVTHNLVTYNVLRVKGAFDYEAIEEVDRIRSLGITVSDAGSNLVVEFLEVTVMDVDDESPMGIGLFVLNGDGTKTELQNIMAEEEGEKVLGTLTAEDADTADEGLSYVIADDRFTIEETSVNSGIYVLKSTLLLNYESGVVNETVVLAITVSDGVNAETVEELTITVIDKGTIVDERIEIISSVFNAIDGGEGFDVLVFNGEIDLELGMVADDLLLNIEEIDLTETGDNSLSLDLEELKAIGGRYLYITGDSGDELITTDTWEAMGIEERNGKSYRIYEQEEAGETYQLLVDSEVNSLGASFNEMILIRDANIVVGIDGGLGFDVLVFDGMGIDLDLTMIADDLLNGIESVDLTGMGDNSLTINALELNALGGLVEGGKTKLIVEGDRGDAISTSDSWTANSTVDYNGETYNLYEQVNYQLLIDTDIDLTGIM